MARADAKVGELVEVTTKNSKEEGILMPHPDKGTILIKLSSGYNIGFNRSDVKSMMVIGKPPPAGREDEKDIITASPQAEINGSEKRKQPVISRAKENIAENDLGSSADKNAGAGKIDTPGGADKTAINKSKKSSPKNALPRVVILHTGGTIASKVDYRTGGVVASISPEELLRQVPELAVLAQVESELIANMWSDDLRFAHFEVIAKAIEKYVKRGVDGIVVGMGTDNLAVAAAAMAFIVENPPVPIIFVGSQRSSDRGSADSAMNLICAVRFAGQSDFAGVAVCMHESEEDTACVILPSTKTYKLHSSRRDALRPINCSAIARVDYKSGRIEMLGPPYLKRGVGKIIIRPRMEEKVGLLKVHINMAPKQFAFFTGYKGLVIEGTGLGHTPGQVPNELCLIHKKIYPAIKKVISSGCVVVMTTQCLFGAVNMNVYDKGRDLLGLGVIPGHDMLAHTALVKLSWLLGNYKIEDVKKMIGENIRGEISERILYDKVLVQMEKKK